VGVDCFLTGGSLPPPPPKGGFQNITDCILCKVVVYNVVVVKL